MSWELAKENVQPLKQGRQLEADSDLCTENSEDAKTLELERRQAALPSCAARPSLHK